MISRNCKSFVNVIVINNLFSLETHLSFPFLRQTLRSYNYFRRSSSFQRWPSYLRSVEGHRWNKGNNNEIQERDWLPSRGTSSSHCFHSRGAAGTEKVWRARAGNFEGFSQVFFLSKTFFLLFISLWVIIALVLTPTCFNSFDVSIFVATFFPFQDTKNRIQYAIESFRSDALVICEKCIILRENRTGIGEITFISSLQRFL